jgi:transposase
MAVALSPSKWMLGFTIGFGQRPRVRTIAARDLAALQNEIHLARERFGLGEEVPVISCYEAGRDGFWLHRYLTSRGVNNLIVDSASIEVNRRAKQAKTDRLDLGKLLTMLMRYQAGEKKVWHLVHVPSVEVEDHRHLHRELTDLKEQRTQHTNRIKGYLSNQGCQQRNEMSANHRFKKSTYQRVACPVGFVKVRAEGQANLPVQTVS